MEIFKAQKPGWLKMSGRLMAILWAMGLRSVAALTVLIAGPTTDGTVLSAAEAPDATTKDLLNRPAPELTGIKGWENSKGITLAELKGKVVVLHFWTFGCINCQHNLPIYNAWQRDFGDKGVEILGIHTPETEDEAKPANVAENVKKRGIEYPVANDSEGSTWKAYGNRYWPAIYLIDRQGKVRFRWDGELESNNAQGDSIMRQKIKALLAEK